MKTVLYQDENILFSFNVYDGKLLIHCEMKDFKLSVLRRSWKIFGAFMNECVDKGIKEFYTVTPNPKFAEIFGGIFSHKMIYENKEYEVYKWELK